MEKNMVFSKLILCLSVLVLLANPAMGLDCGHAVSALISCESYLLGMGSPKPSTKCCNSAQALNKTVASKKERRFLCECFKQIIPTLGVNFGRMKQLPISCKLNLHMTITPDIDCNKV